VTFATDSEGRFADYLDRNHHRWEYEPPSLASDPGGRVPDFGLVENGVLGVACEVTDVTWWNMSSGGPPRTYEAVRSKLQEKHKQIRHLKGRLAIVLVLDLLPVRHSHLEIIPGALFGDLGVRFSVDAGSTQQVSSETIFQGGGRLQKYRLTSFSAVGVLGSFSPSLAAANRRINDRLSALSQPPTVAEVTAASAQEVWGRTFDDYVPRLDLFHNPFAVVPLPIGYFGGLYDREWSTIGPGYGWCASGTHFPEAAGDLY